MSQSDSSLLEVYIYENLKLLEELEGLLLAAEKSSQFTGDQVGSIFRILHTIKGSSAMMEFEGLSKLSHALEDLFGFIREHNDDDQPIYDHRKVCELVFSAQDLLRSEIEGMQSGQMPVADPADLLAEIKICYDQCKRGLSGEVQAPAVIAPNHIALTDPAAPAAHASGATSAKSFYKAVVFFEKDCQMENVRAFGIIKSIEELCDRIATIPEDVLNDQSDDMIVANGLIMFMQSEASIEELQTKIAGNLLIKTLEFEQITDISQTPLDRRAKREAQQQPDADVQAAMQQQQAHRHNYMSVRLDKLDKLMDLVGEIVTTETTVTKNPDIIGLKLEAFSKAARQLHKLTDELQDTVMSIRMIPISATFHKLERTVRDICKKTDKRANLVMIGEDTEMDKNVIDNLSDPLMHIIRNAIDHGIETPGERLASGKESAGTVTLEARNTGGDIIITVSDDGRGLNKDLLVQKGIERGLVKKPANEMTDKEAFSLIFQPGFSTKEAVTEFSGRGVGMDVAIKNITKMGGSISVDSKLGEGMTVQLRIPLTLAIIDGMQVGVGKSIFIVPLLNIRESFKPKKNDVFVDPDGREMIIIREHCLSVVQLHRLLGIETEVTNFEDGILIHMESDGESYCMFVDRLIGEQQVVIKPMPPYIARFDKWAHRIAGCTILGDGSVSLILDINHLSE